MAENPYVYMLVGVMGIIILGHWFPSLKKLEANSNIDRLDDISGIDLRALAFCRQRGLM